MVHIQRSLIGITVCVIAVVCSQLAIAQNDCDTFLGSIRDPKNNCAPCTNGMEKLMHPLLSYAKAKAEMDLLNQSLRLNLEAEQAAIDRLAGLQSSMNRRVNDWGLNDLSGQDGPSYTDPAILQHEIEEMDAFARRFPETREWLNAWKQKLQSFVQVLNEAKQLEAKAAALAQQIRDAQLGNLSKMQFDCCPSAREDGRYTDDQTTDLHALFAEYDALLQQYEDMRTRITDEGAQFLQMLKALLAQRSGDEQEAIARRDQFSDGLLGFVSAKIGELISSGIEDAFRSTSGQELTPDQQRVLEELSQRASGQITTAMSGGGVSGMTAESLGNIIRDVASGMSENDREALALISEEVFAEIGSRIMDKITEKLALRMGQKWLLQGLGAAALPIELLNQLITVPLYLWEDKNRMILQEGYDLIVVGLVKCIQLSRSILAHAPYRPVDAYLDRLAVDVSGTVRPIEICLPPAEPLHADAKAMLRAFFEAAFPDESVGKLHDNERAEVIDGGSGPNSRYLNYIYNNQVRFHVRFGCYCGELVEKTAQSTVPSPWSEITLTSDRMKPGYPFVPVVKEPFPWVLATGAVVGTGALIYVVFNGEKEEDCTFTASANVTHAFCGQADGSISISVSPPDDYTYAWSTSATTPLIQNLNAGSYSVNITRTGTECVQTVFATVENSVIDFHPTIAPDAAHCGAQDGSITISDLPSGYTYNYIWSNGETGPTISNLASDVYIVTISAVGTCMEIYSIPVGQLPPDFVIDITPTPASCGIEDGSAAATVNGSDVYEFLWSNESTEPTLTGVGPGEYFLTVTIEGTNCQLTSSVIISELPPDFVVTVNSTPASCGIKDGTATVTVEPPANYDFVWSTGSTEATITELGVGGYQVTVTLSGTTCQQTGSVDVAESAPAFTMTFNTTPAGCGVSDGTAEVVVDPPGAYDFLWSNGMTTQQITGLAPGEYTVTATIQGTSCALSASVQVEQVPVSFTLTINTTPATCGISNGTATVVVDPPGEYTYQWPNGSTLPQSDGIGAGTYVLTVTDQFGCTSSGSFSITETPADYIGSTSTVPGNCLGEGADIILELFTPGAGPMEITATGPDGVHVVSVSPGTINLNTLFTVLPGGWQIVVRDLSLAAQCMEQADVVVEDNTVLVSQDDQYSTTTDQPVSGNILDNDNGLQLTVGDYTEPAGGVLILNPDGTFTFFPPAGATGQFTFQYMAEDVCGNNAIANVVITVNSGDCLFAASFAITHEDCGLMNGTITTELSPPGNYTFIWSNGQSTQDLIDVPAGQYSVTITSVDLNCDVSYIVTVPENPLTIYVTNLATEAGNCTGEGEITITLETPGDGPLVLVVTGPEGTIQFTLPEGTHNLSSSMNIPSGDYEITVYDQGAGEQCSQTVNTAVPDNTPDLSATDDAYETAFDTPVSGNVLNNDDGLGLVLTDVTQEEGGIVEFNPDGSFTYTPDPGFSGFGSFTYTVTDACGSTSTAFVEIFVEMGICDFTAQFINTNATCGFEDGIISTIVDPPGSYFYEWSNGDIGQTITNVPAGIYTVTIEDVNLGCSLEFETEVGEDPAEYVSNIQVLQPLCPSQGDIRFELSSQGGGPFDVEVILPDGTTVDFTVPEGLVSLIEFVPISDGEYTITVFDVNAGPSCTETFSATINGANTLEITVEAIIPPSEPTSMDGAIVIVVTMPGTLPYEIFLNGESWGVAIADAFTIGGLGAGDYTVQIEDANGCLSNILFVTVPLPGSLGLEVGFGLGMLQNGPVLLPEQPQTAGHTMVSSFVDVGLHYRVGGIKQLGRVSIYRDTPDNRSAYRFSHLVELGGWRYKGFNLRAHGGLSVDMIQHARVSQYLTLNGSVSKRLGRMFTASATVSLRGWEKIERPVIEVGVRMPMVR